MPTDVEKMRAKAKQLREERERRSQRPRGGGVSVTRTPKSKRIKIDCQYDGDDVVYVHFDQVKHATSKSVLLRIGDRDEWIPFSQLRDLDVDDRVMVCSEFIAREKGLESDW